MNTDRWMYMNLGVRIAAVEVQSSRQLFMDRKGNLSDHDVQLHYSISLIWVIMTPVLLTRTETVVSNYYTSV